LDNRLSCENGPSFRSSGSGTDTPTAAHTGAGTDCVIGVDIASHMLRHACSYKLANDEIDTRALLVYLGHRYIQNTMRYTALAPGRFKGFWHD
jgi:integrase